MTAPPARPPGKRLFTLHHCNVILDAMTDPRPAAYRDPLLARHHANLLSKVTRSPVRSVSDLRRALRQQGPADQLPVPATPRSAAPADFAYDSLVPPWNAAHPDPFTRAEHILLEGFAPEAEVRNARGPIRGASSPSTSASRWPDRLAQPMQQVLDTLREGQRLLQRDPSPTQAAVTVALQSLIGTATPLPTFPTPRDGLLGTLAGVLDAAFFRISPDHVSTMRWHALASAYAILGSFSTVPMAAPVDSFNTRQGLTAYPYICHALDDLLRSTSDALGALSTSLDDAGLDTTSQRTLLVPLTAPSQSLYQVLANWQSLIDTALPGCLWTGAAGLSTLTRDILALLLDTANPLRALLRVMFPVAPPGISPQLACLQRVMGQLHSAVITGASLWGIGTLWAARGPRLARGTAARLRSGYARYTSHVANTAPRLQIRFPSTAHLTPFAASTTMVTYVPSGMTVRPGQLPVPVVVQEANPVIPISNTRTVLWTVAAPDVDGGCGYAVMALVATNLTSPASVLVPVASPLHIT